MLPRQSIGKPPGVGSDATPSPSPSTAPLLDFNRLNTCLVTQVFPHISSKLGPLENRGINTSAIGQQLVAVLVNQEFKNEFYRRGDGTISQELEAKIAQQAEFLIAGITQRITETSHTPPPPVPSQTLVPASQFFFNPPVDNSGFTSFYNGYNPGTTVPMPPPRPTPPIPPRPAPSPAVRPISTTPIPPPVTLPYSPAPPKTQPPRQSVCPPTQARPPPEVIVIDDDDDDDDEQQSLQAAQPTKRVQTTEIPKVTEPVQPPKALNAAKTEKLVVDLSRSSQPVAKLLPHGTALYHVDFTDDEVSVLNDLVKRNLRRTVKPGKDARKDLAKFLKKNPATIPVILDAVRREKLLPRRERKDIGNFLSDLVNSKATTKPTPAVLTVGVDEDDKRGNLVRSSRVHSLLFAREICGHRGVGSMRTLARFTNEFKKCREDAMEKRAEWTGCAGDVSTVVWVSNDGFICGTTEHSDAHNQQYNKPSNLVLGSCGDVTLRAYPEHRIVRPVVDKGENATEAMRQSQDPWLYASVVSSDYDAANDRAFTSSFDHTVKIWKVEHSGASMKLLGEWKHDGNVNFVSASKDGLVATASDVAMDAIRIYKANDADISNSPFRSYSCSRVDEMGNAVSTEKWAYYPATMQWGRAEGVKHLLLVGYSPRSRTGDDNDIPEDRRNAGELCLWDGMTGERWKITSATRQNVFEVLWHPTQDVFIAATSPSGLDLEPSIRTQIRIFTPADKDIHGTNAFSPIMTLDCTAIDVNELTIMPNSIRSCYITAGCTDGNTYVWDTGRGDKPIHVLAHGEPIDEYRGDREREDVGVKFTAWGTTPDRFYTGSSDGVVKVWNVRCEKNPLVRNLLEAPAPITAGMFCPDKSRLVVGDASGRVFLLSMDEEKPQPVTEMKIPLPGGQFKVLRRPPAVIPHPDPPPPTYDAEGRPIVPETGPARGRAYLQAGMLERHPDPTIGVVQGPRYAETGLFRREMHFNEDPSMPLLARWEALQQEAVKPPFRSSSSSLAGVTAGTGGGRRRERNGLALRPVRDDGVQVVELLHRGNLDKECEIEAQIGPAWRELEEGGIDMRLMKDDYVFAEEDGYCFIEEEEW
ncbi:hypothetical protein VTJ49DRAFT_6704 [Mycothermus thermophilus]|uniref:WD40 repeat-like protein n=1 Tax=Humicola insolens TaxID=85995 RepID=A0ABR3V0Y3_HUMIN